MTKIFTTTWSLLKKTFQGFVQDDSFSYASSIAFSTIFSLPAILIISISIASAFYEKDQVQEELINQAGRLIGRENALEIEKILRNANTDSDSTFAKIIGIVTIIFSATTVFVSLQSSLNKMWEIKPKPEKNVLKYIINRLLSFAMVISLGFVLLVSLFVDAFLIFFKKFIARVMGDSEVYFLAAINIAVSLAIITLIFALMFKVLPDARIKWRDVWVGAFITTIFFTIGKYLIGLYLGNSSINSAYGAAGSLVIILVWVYYSTVILLFGAEFTSVFASEKGRSIVPNEHAVKFKIVETTK